MLTDADADLFFRHAFPVVGKGLGILFYQLTNELFLTPEIFKSLASVEYGQKNPLMEKGMSLKNIAIGLNVLLILLCVGFFAGHGLPKSLMLWGSAILWFVAPIVNLIYIRQNS